MSENLPAKIKSNLPAKAKEVATRGGKIALSTLATSAFTATTLLGVATLVLPSGVSIISIASAIPLTVLSIPGLVVSLQKLLNNTGLQSAYDDILFTTKNFGKDITIGQDFSRADMIGKLNQLGDLEKAGFLQLQTIVGLSKVSEKQKHKEIKTQSNDVVRSALHTLNELGYIEGYEESFEGKTLQPLENLLFGNFKSLIKPINRYNMKFRMSDKKIDINDEELRKRLPLVFSARRGLLQKQPYNIITNPDGSLSIDYNYKGEKVQCEDLQEGNAKQNEFKAELSEGAPTLDEQAKVAQEFIERAQTLEEIVREPNEIEVKEDEL